MTLKWALVGWEVPKQTKAREKRSAGKRYPLNMRTTKDVRERLEAVAARAGRSLAQEVEFRLDRSFDQGDLLAEVLRLRYGPTLACALYLIGETMYDAGLDVATFAGRDTQEWMDDPQAFDLAARTAHLVLEACRPSGKFKNSPNFPPEQFMANGLYGRDFITEAASGETTLAVNGAKERARELRQLAGDSLSARLAAFLRRERE